MKSCNAPQIYFIFIFCDNFYFLSLLDFAMQNVFLVALGGAIGAVLRWSWSQFPNIQHFECHLIDQSDRLILSWGSHGWVFTGPCFEGNRAFVGYRLLGSFTTMSAYALQTVEMSNSSGFTSMAIYVVLTSLGCPLMALSGWKLMSVFT